MKERILIVRLGRCGAKEQRPVEAEISPAPSSGESVSARLARIRRFTRLPDRPHVVNLVSGLGGYIAAFSRQGCYCQGLEPWVQARENTGLLAQKPGITLRSLDGTGGERPPFAMLEYGQ